MKICIISGSRSELDLLKNLILEIKKDKFFNSKLLVTGSHLSKFFGNTVEYIKNQNLNIHNYINISIKGDSSEQVSKSFSLGVTKFTKIFSKIKPDAIVVLGDRYEIFSSVISATLKKIPVVHIHGGEVTAGSMDEGIRHSITKLSHIHFVSTEEYKRRVIQLGENKKNVFNVGSLGAQSIKKIKLLNKKEGAHIFIETPYRNNQLLSDLIKNIQPPSKKITLAICLTGKDEKIITKTVNEIKKLDLDLNKKPTIFIFE